MISPLKRLVVAVLIPLLAAPPAAAQEIDYSLDKGAFWNLGIYRQRHVAEVDLTDSHRLDRLIRGGKLYLSLADALAAALENNLDIAVGRYAPLEADTDVLRARAGAQLSGVQTQISTLSTGQSTGGGGFVTGPAGQATGITQGAAQQAQTAGGGAGNAASFFGTQVTSLEPVLTSTTTFARTSNPQISNFVTGTNTLINDTRSWNMAYSQGFVTGTTVNVNMTAFRQSNNNIRNSFNPTLTAGVTVSITQRLTQGFGRAVNTRNIRIARNNQEIEDLNFKQQVIATIGQVKQLYFDLVRLREIAAARRLDVELSERLVRDTAKQAELGLQARIEVTRSRAEATTFRQQLVQAETDVREQQEILKNALTKHGPTSDTLAGVEIIPTDRVVFVDQERIEPLSDLVAAALAARPELATTRINLQNSEINLRGIKNALRPAVDVTAFATNNGLAGVPNPNVVTLPGDPPPDPFFVGGLGSAFGQVFRRNFPDFGVQFRVNIPLKNRQAQADMTRELVRRRRSDIQLRQQENSIKLDVSRSLARLEQAREGYQIAREDRELREEMVEGERKRFALGSSTIFQIIQAQRDLATARTNEINALNSYQSAKIDMERVTGRTLSANNVSIGEAESGSVSREPDPIPPALLNSGAGAGRPIIVEVMRALSILLLSAAPLMAGDLPTALSPEDVGLSSERLEVITRTIEADVAAGRVAGATALIARQGQVAYFRAFGQADREADRAMIREEIFRIYSMSKPITSVAVMMLFEEGKFRLKDRVSKYLPELKEMDVLIDDPEHPGDASRARREKARRDMTVQDLLRHTAGLTYGYFGNTAADQRYMDAEVLSTGGTLADMITKLGSLPLLHHPGENWHYSVSVDVLGRLVEKLSGKRFDKFLAERIFEPLEMTDTGFHAPKAAHGRFAQLYAPSKDDKEKLGVADPEISKRYMAPGTFFSGGGGLVSTTADYLRFCQMMLNGGELDGRRLLGRKTAELMTIDHVEGIDPERIAETGYGFGLGFAVHLDQAASGSAASLGEYNWGGAAGTRFWIDPSEEMIGIYMVQILPHSGLSYGEIFKQQAYQAIVD